MNLLRKFSFFASAVSLVFVCTVGGVVKTKSGSTITTSEGMPVMVGDADVTKGMKGVMMSKDMDMSQNTMRTSNNMMMYKGVRVSSGKDMSNTMMKNSKMADAMMSSHNLFFAFNSTKISKMELNKLLPKIASLKSARSIVVVGHTDAKGSDYANNSVSKRRAEAVKALLGRLGVHTRKVMVKAKGAKEPMVHTTKGMREARNRRVEIMPVM